ncbi:MAG TPA: FtsW/RodA/SpoVE family cell cycle protein [Fimbriimonas sp.]|nr:FtsW/RodA/SpoVE family cell cycle protein [Fimbriimonas sp.]
MNRTSKFIDPGLFFLALLATALGLFFIFDAGYPRSIGLNRGMWPPEFKNQLTFLVPSLIACMLCARVRPETWQKVSKPIWLVVLAMLGLIFKLGVEMNGAKRWLGVGPALIQPAELAKLAAVLYLAGVFAERKPWPANLKPRRDWVHWMDTIAIPKLRRAFPGILILFAAVLIDKEPDLGTAAVMAVAAFALFIPGGVSKKSLIAAVLVAVCGSWALVKQEPYRLERIRNHIERWRPDNVDDTSYQTVQSELAMASGGLFGVGVGNGRAKHVIPATTTDFILATIAEEFGLVGALGVLAVLAAIVWRLLRLSAKAPTKFGRLVLFGFASWFGIQACVNVMMANGFLPAIGIPLPFISSGGSSLLTLWCAVGVAQSVCRAPSPAKEKQAARPASGRAVVSPSHPRMGARLG